MNTLLKLLACLCTPFLFSCHTVNLAYDNAAVLEKDEVKITGNYSKYTLHANYGLSLAYGMSDKWTMDVRYERFNSVFSDIIRELQLELEQNDWEVEGNLTNYINLHYLRLGNKISIKKDKIAFSIPAEVYFNKLGYLPSVSPQFLMTLRKKDFLECTLIPKVNMLFTIQEGDFYGAFFPSISLGLGLSNNLDKWAIRPEIGYQIDPLFGGTFSWGIGISFNKK